MTETLLNTEASLPADQEQKVSDCWNRMGVWAGNGATCERLMEVIHCRNCETFIAAGRLIFERESPAEYQQENLAVYAVCEPVSEGESIAVIVFRLGQELFALPTHVLDVITKSKSIHRLPHMKSAYVQGVVNISGEICLCHSLMAVLNVDAYVTEKGGNDRYIYRRLIVVHIEDGRYVFPVDEIKGMNNVQTENLRSAPATITEEVKQLLNGAFKFEGKDVAVLDAAKLHQILSNGLL